ncbi:MAG: hypothetical protein GXY76_07880 [Chloroflexi bacterium]|nr:hypothetical protein [Chloroflexota bacterium]
MPKVPLFPLNVVLFPGMILPLHIFEERYKAMVNDCIASGDPFGVVLVPEDAEEAQQTPYCSVGTVAHINEVERLSDGRMNIIVLGRQRFSISHIVQHEPYLVAEVDFYAMEQASARPGSAEAERNRRLMNQVRGLLPGYLDLLGQNLGRSISIGRMPSGIASVAYLVAIVLQIPLWEKQALLEVSTYGELLLQEEALLRRETLFLQYAVDTAPREDSLWPYPPSIMAN